MRGFVDMEAVTRDAEAVWAADASVRAEFTNKETYLAFRKADARGTVRILGKPGGAAMVRPTRAAAADADAAVHQAEQTWAADAAVRAEFHGNKEAWLAYSRSQALGLAKIHGQTNKVPAQSEIIAPQPHAGAGSLAERQAQARQENVGRQFAGLPPLAIPQQ